MTQDDVKLFQTDFNFSLNGINIDLLAYNSYEGITKLLLEFMLWHGKRAVILFRDLDLVIKVHTV